ncbi:hypothetical protein AM1_A0319 (plasmid) [Acaryochloris marina MBIC11017]|uniref:Uncharacterized protein n=1 Tax=Acaryochloris marina (strain MBIC 11017) TaxID=329726 RepID=A8ZKW9_ACAM1|nr:hypothetical protein AM1_A0319 [Acaryochloris marina MBIC11017]
MYPQGFHAILIHRQWDSPTQSIFSKSTSPQLPIEPDFY